LTPRSTAAENLRNHKSFCLNYVDFNHFIVVITRVARCKAQPF
jgi:hypothetical protein